MEQMLKVECNIYVYVYISFDFLHPYVYKFTFVSIFTWFFMIFKLIKIKKLNTLR